jgi:WXG100 family type VII secretion target
MGITSLQQGVHNQSADHVESVNAEMKRAIDMIRTEAENVKGSWTGTASASFQQLMVQYNDNATKLYTTLQGIADGIRQNGKAYDSSEETNRDSLNKQVSAVEVSIPGINA